jgi:hypothetical protein
MQVGILTVFVWALIAFIIRDKIFKNKVKKGYIGLSTEKKGFTFLKK